MSYAPSTFYAGTGEDFFRKEGFLIDGMEPLITGRYAIPSPDDSDGTTFTITDSVAKAGTGAASSWIGYNLSASKTKLLAIAYVQSGATNYAEAAIVFHVGTCPTTTAQNCYQGFMYPYSSEVGLYEASGGSWTQIAYDATIYQAKTVSAPLWGVALYVDADNDVQKVFVKSGTANWLPVLSTTDTDHDSFQSVLLRSYGASSRFVTPFYVWGS